METASQKYDMLQLVDGAIDSSGFEGWPERYSAGMWRLIVDKLKFIVQSSGPFKGKDCRWKGVSTALLGSRPKSALVEWSIPAPPSPTTRALRGMTAFPKPV